jgi:RNA polymerase sigma-70 factor (ECF subfamily)
MMINSMRLISKILPRISTEMDWEGVYRQEYPRIYNFFRFRAGDDTQAEDLTAEVFERAWRGRHRYSNNLGAFEAWLFGIARKVAASHFRELHKVPLESDIYGHEDTLLTPEDQLVEVKIQHQQDIEQLSTRLACLSDRERELIAFKYGAGLNNREIADLTSLSESNVGTILHRTVQKLRRDWEG